MLKCSSLLSIRTVGTLSVSKVWVKTVNAKSPSRVSLAACLDVDDLVDAIKRKLPNQLSNFDVNELTLHTSMDGPALRLDLSIAELLQYYKDPLIVKPPPPKTIHVRDIVNGYLMDTYTTFTCDSDVAVEKLYMSFKGGRFDLFRGLGFLKENDPTTCLNTLHELEDGVKYVVYSVSSNYNGSFVKS